MKWMLIALNLSWWQPVEFNSYIECVRAWQTTEVELQKIFPVLNPRLKCVEGQGA